MHAALGIPLGHLLVQDAPASRHPLHVPGSQAAAVAQTVAVGDSPGQHVGDGLDAAVRVPWESGPVVLGVVVAEIVEQQEGIEVIRLAEAESAVQPHTGPFDRRRTVDDALDRAYGHDSGPRRKRSCW